MALSNDIENETEEQYDEVFLDETENNNPKLDLCEPATSLLRYFQFQKGDAKTKCRMCGRQIARKDGNTSGMVRHLKLHSKTYKDFCAAKASKTVQKKKTSSEESSSQKSMKQMNLDFRAHEKWPTTHQKSQKIDDLILRFICLSAEPIQLTEKNGFSEIFDEICPSYRLKSREFMTKLLEEKYSEKFELLKKTIDAAPFISFTTDLWTNKKKKKNFLSLTAHYIDEGDRTFCQLRKLQTSTK
uniref:BED-type domain-containing protein n=1 Tax=Globodera rostochiensis TaxID=31243 RepID=A0A914I428_GLORO